METAYYKSPIGFLKITASEKGITEINFTKKKTSRAKPTSCILTQCFKELDEYFSGKRKQFTVPLETQGTAFQKKVWKSLVKIPYGKTLAYSDIAEKIDKPKACRAVGMANNRNKIAIVIPCHRVIGKSGKLVGYASGLKHKEWLLEHEKNT
ncbi:MAG: methylated-DNA--[protein]-cysteine S-methyltransferase [bacterium]|nr:methylated-DNA--[protein]-cysteine S-methyltransferase [bacterium]MBU1918186.1 methylated-DNA--[protein]-cysteine S-methyltransferase [bacterium]